MSLELHFTPSDAATELRLIGHDGPIPPSAWPLSGHPVSDLAQSLILLEEAIEGEDALLVENRAVARLTAAEAARIGLPPLSSLRAVIEGSGFMTRPDFEISLRWTRPGGQNVLGAARTGAWLREAEGWRRLSETLFGVAEAVDRYAQLPATDETARMRALVTLREVLPQAATAGTADATGMLGRITLLEADALSLGAEGEGEALRLIPILHHAGTDTPLLSEDAQNVFGRQQFMRFPSAKGIYTLPGGIYVVLAPPLRQALEVVRRVASRPTAERRRFLREPRAAIRAAIGDEADAALIDSLVLETPQWSERVIGLGLWKPRVLPWIQIEGHDWFGAPPAGATEGTDPRGLVVGDRRVTLTPDQAEELSASISAAIDCGQDTVPFDTPEGPLAIPADTGTLRAVQALRRIAQEGPAHAAEVLLIKPNEQGRDIEAMVGRRPTPRSPRPAMLRTSLKDHQVRGLEWLQDNWRQGMPGVLLADDMGLGKTLQGLTFLAWLREGMAKGELPREPVLIVAPTGLLENWKEEHDRHLSAPGLGTLVQAYGKGLKPLRVPDDSGGALHHAILQSADWVLTTYETLRDHDRDFGAVRFAAMLMDEAQKVKTPGIRLTDAAKAMNADFRVALTGTPVENRLSDLWCIVDGVAPGHLEDLKRFSSRFEADTSLESLQQLKASLDQPVGGRPPLLLRRLKRDELKDLPRSEEVVLKAPMRGRQLQAYEEALALGRADQGAGKVLEALQRLKATSLHPDPSATTDDDSFIAASARLELTIQALDRIASRRERALVFVDDLSLMAHLAGLLQRRYRLPATPMTINGQVAGAARQTRVNRFQEAPEGFDVMLLSPRAGGVGLTLTRANHVIHLARWWNPAVEDQCTGRVLRIGQDKPVTVHLPLAILPDGRPSFDEKLHSLLDRKRRLMRDALMPAEPDTREGAALLDETLG